MTHPAMEALVPQMNWPADHEFTSGALPDIIHSGAVRSWEVDMPGCDATVGEIDPGTAAVFPADPRGEHLTLIVPPDSLGRLALVLVRGEQARFVTLDETNPAVQTVPGQLIVIPKTGPEPTYYLCEYRNEEGQLPIEVSPGFESVRSILWNLTHHHPKAGYADTGANILEIDRALGPDTKVSLSFSTYEPGKICITGPIKVDGIQVSDERDLGVFVLRTDGSMSFYSQAKQIERLTETEKADLYKWLEAHFKEWWTA